MFIGTPCITAIHIYIFIQKLIFARDNEKTALALVAFCLNDFYSRQ